MQNLRYLQYSMTFIINKGQIALASIPKRTMWRRMASRTVKGLFLASSVSSIQGVLFLWPPLQLNVLISPFFSTRRGLIFLPSNAGSFFARFVLIFFTRPDARYNQEKGPFLLPMTSFLSDEARAGIFCGVASETNLSLRCHCSTLLGQQCNMISALFVQAF